MGASTTGARAAADPSRILVVEDDSGIAGVVAYQLTRAGFRVETASTGTAGLESLHRNVPDMVVLDRMLPDLSGDELLKIVRSDPGTRAVPVLVLTARRQESERIEGFEMGADDYLTKPFSPRELVLRVEAILRRARSPWGRATRGGRVLGAGELRVNLGSMRVSVAGRHVHLTPTEIRLLTALVENKGRTLGRDRLIREAWIADGKAERRTRRRTVDIHIRRLRSKLAHMGSWIETVRGFGYRFRAPPAP